jgi:hypothetical protein
LERFAHHEVLIQVLSSHPAASSISSAEVLGALQHACSTGNARQILTLCCLPSAKALSLAQLIPIMTAAAAATDDEGVVRSLFQIPAAQQMTAAAASAILKSAISDGDGSLATEPCHLLSAWELQQLSVAEVAAVMRPALEVSQPRSLAQFACSLPATQHFSPMEVAAVLHTAIESIYVGISIPEMAVILQLCELPGAKKMGGSQVQGLLEAVEDCDAAGRQQPGTIVTGLGQGTDHEPARG